jgi:DNA-binding CsgD family transcriptional regulator
MATERARRRCREDVVALSARPGNPFALRFAIVERLRPVVGFDRWCWPVCDPASGLAATALGEHDYWDVLPRLLLLDQRRDARDSLPMLAGASITGGYESGARFQDVLGPVGIGDELRVPLRDHHGLWGCLDLMRAGDDHAFDDDDVELLDSLVPALAAVARRSTAASFDVADSAAVPSAGAIVLDEELTVRASTAAAREWLERLAPRGMPHAELAASAPVFNVAARVLAGADEALPARARVRTIDGAWGVVEAGTLDPQERTVAVTIRPATTPEIVDLRLLAYDLTARERELVGIVLAGNDTREIAATLYLSRHTVQDHLKSVFAKTGVRTRRELVARLTVPS